MTAWIPAPYLVERETSAPAIEYESESNISNALPWTMGSSTVQMPGWEISLSEKKKEVVKKEDEDEPMSGTKEELIDPDFDKSKYEVRMPDPNDKPIPFTEEEIEDIVSAIPNVEAGDSCTASACLMGLKENLRYQLRREAIAPSAKDIPRLKDIIVKRYYAARINRGTSVGISASSNVGSSITQMSFDAFKALGGDDGGMGSGVRGMKNILYAVMNRHDPSSIIHFNMLVNSRDVYDIAGRVVETFVGDFVEKKEILPFSKDYEGDNAELRAQRYWWHDMYEVFTGHPLPEPVYILRLHLNRVKMYEYRVTPDMIANSIETERMSKTIEKAAAEGSMFAVVYSPLEDGILDIIPDELLLAKNWAESNKFSIPFLSQLYLSTVVEPGLKKLRLGGIPGIKSITPLKVDIGNIFLEYIRLNTYEIERLRAFIENRLKQEDVDDENWEGKVMYATISKRNMVSKGLPYKNMLILAEMSKIVIIQEKRNALNKPTELLVYVPSGKTIAEHFNNFVSKNKDDDTLIESDSPMMGNRQWTLGEYIQALNTYTYAYTRGSNLLEILKIPWVDKKRTVCNNMHEIVLTFGIEATQIYIAGSLVGVLEGSGISSSSVGANSRHIMLISDFMTNRGLPYGATYSGNTRQGKGVISAASIERSMLEFLNSAPYNKTETINTAASSQWTGTTIPAGSCAGLQFPTKEDVEHYRQKIRDEMESMRRRQESRDPEKVHLYRQGKSSGMEEASIANIGTMMKYIGGEELDENEYLQDTSSLFDPTRPMPTRKVIPDEELPSDVLDPIKILDMGAPAEVKKQEPIIKNVALQQTIHDTLNKQGGMNMIPLTIPTAKFQSYLPMPEVESHYTPSLIEFVKSKLSEYMPKIQQGYLMAKKIVSPVPPTTSFVAPSLEFYQPDYSKMSAVDVNRDLLKSVPMPDIFGSSSSTSTSPPSRGRGISSIPTRGTMPSTRGSGVSSRGSGVSAISTRGRGI